MGWMSEWFSWLKKISKTAEKISSKAYKAFSVVLGPKRANWSFLWWGFPATELPYCLEIDWSPWEWHWFYIGEIRLKCMEKVVGWKGQSCVLTVSALSHAWLAEVPLLASPPIVTALLSNSLPGSLEHWHLRTCECTEMILIWFLGACCWGSLGVGWGEEEVEERQDEPPWSLCAVTLWSSLSGVSQFHIILLFPT